jgi:hypothetical protein
MHAFIHHSIAQKFSSLSYCFLFDQTFPCMFIITKGIFFTNFKIGLNQFRVYLQNFQTNSEKEKGKEKEKNRKGRRAPFRPKPRNSPRPNSPSSRTGTPLPSLLLLTRGTHLAAPTSSLASTRKTRLETARSPHD